MSDWMALWTRMNTLSEIAFMHGTDKCVFVRCALGRKGAANIVKVQCIPELLLDFSQRFSFCKFCKPVKALAHPHEDGFEAGKVCLGHLQASCGFGYCRVIVEHVCY